jgi:Protein of unknown function (DUF3102)
MRADRLAVEINRQHAQAAAALAAGTAHAIRAGELLIEAKAKVGHGGWAKWQRDNLSFSSRTAQVYMQLARLEPQKRNAVADLALRRAVLKLQEGQRDEEAATRRAATPSAEPIRFAEAPRAPAVEEPVSLDAVADELIGQLIEAALEEDVPIELLLAALLRRMPKKEAA